MYSRICKLNSNQLEAKFYPPGGRCKPDTIENPTPTVLRTGYPPVLSKREAAQKIENDRSYNLTVEKHSGMSGSLNGRRKRDLLATPKNV